MMASSLMLKVDVTCVLNDCNTITVNSDPVPKRHF